MKNFTLVLLALLGIAAVFARPDGTPYKDPPRIDAAPVTTVNFLADNTLDIHYDRMTPCTVVFYKVPVGTVVPGSYFTATVNASRSDLIVRWQYGSLPTEFSLPVPASSAATQAGCPTAGAGPATCVFNNFCSFTLSGDYYIGVWYENAAATYIDFDISIKKYAVSPTILSNAVEFPKGSHSRPPTLNHDEPEFYDHFKYTHVSTHKGSWFTVELANVNSNMTVAPSTAITLRIRKNNMALAACFDQLSCYASIQLPPNTPISTVLADCSKSDPDESNGAITMKYDPCKWSSADYWISVGFAEGRLINYTIKATSDFPVIDTLVLGTVYQDDVSDRLSHFYYLNLTGATNLNTSRLVLTISNLVGGPSVKEEVGLYVARTDLPRGKDGCIAPIDYTESSWQGNAVVDPCDLVPGDYYVAVDALFGGNPPVLYTLKAELQALPTPTTLPLGYFHAAVEEKLYDWYTIDLSAHLGGGQNKDETFYFELFLDDYNTDVSVYLRPGTQLTGKNPTNSTSTCRYANPEWTCTTGAGVRSCSWMLKTCLFTTNTIQVSVYGEPKGYQAPHKTNGTGSNTYYGQPTAYTIWTQVIRPMPVVIGQSYSQSVELSQYNHYTLNVPSTTPAGTVLRVAFTDVAGGTIGGYVRYGDLAGECPCYKSVKSCSASTGGECGLTIQGCELYGGNWYFSASASAQAGASHVGYTLTVTLEPPKTVSVLAIGDDYVTPIKDKEIHHYYLGEKPAAGNDLQITVVMDQDNAANDVLDVYLGAEGLASLDCSSFSCSVKTGPGSDSFCTIYVPDCKWPFKTGKNFLAVTGSVVSVNNNRYTVRTRLVPSKLQVLSDGVAVSQPIHASHIHDFSIAVAASDVTSKTLYVEVYTNRDKTDSSLSVYLNQNAVAGPDTRCRTNIKKFTCTSQSFCHLAIEACELVAGTYYVGVLAPSRWKYDVDSEYTIKAWFADAITTLTLDQPVTGRLYTNDLHKYRFSLPAAPTIGQSLLVKTANIRSGTAVSYLRYPNTGNVAAGPCPCYESDVVSGSEIDEYKASIPYCVLNKLSTTNAFSYSVFGDSQTATVPVGYVVLATLDTPNITLGMSATSSPQARAANQTLSNQKYWHYEVDYAPSTGGKIPQLQLDFIDVSDGSIDVYVRRDRGDNAPADADSKCHDYTKSCVAGPLCSFRIPPCAAFGKYWVSVRGTTAGKPVMSYTFEPKLVLLRNVQVGSAASRVDLVLTTQTPEEQVYLSNIGSPSGTSRLVVQFQVYAGSITVAVNQNARAGLPSCDAPCAGSVKTVEGSVCNANCNITVPSCAFGSGDWFVSVMKNGAANANITVQATVFDTPAAIIINPNTNDTVAGTSAEPYQVFRFTVPANFVSNSAFTGTRLDIVDTTVTTGLKSYVRFGAVPAENCFDLEINGPPSFSLPACCIKQGDYYILVKSPGSYAHSIKPYRFPTPAVQSISVGNMFFGAVPAFNYNFLKLTVPDMSTKKSSLFINVTDVFKDSTTTPFPVNVYVRKDSVAGNKAGQCLTSTFECSGTGGCYLQLPYCDVSAGDWYISIYNPNNIVDNGIKYRILADVRDPIPVALGEWRNTTEFGAGVHQYQVTINSADVTEGDDIEFGIQEVFSGSIKGVYVRFGEIAGDNSSKCYGNSFPSAATKVVVNYCDFAGKFGTFYVAVITNGDARYAFRVLKKSNTYSPIPLNTEFGGGNGFSSSASLYIVSANAQPVTAPATLYYSVTLAPAKLDETTYMLFKFQNVSLANITATIRRGCTSYSFSSSSGDVVFDPQSGTPGISPCAVESGEYKITLDNSGRPNFVLQVYIFNSPSNVGSPTPVKLLESVVSPSQLTSPSRYLIQNNEYHFFWFTVNGTAPAATLNVAVTVECGTVDVFLRKMGTSTDVAGPACFDKKCSTSSGVCTINVDTCELQEGDYALTVRGATQTYKSTQFDIDTSYYLSYKVSRITVVDHKLDCPITSSAAGQSVQYRIWVPSLSYGETLQFDFTGANGKQVWISRNSTVGSFASCTSLFSSTIGATGTLSKIVDSCTDLGQFSEGRGEGEWYYIKMDSAVTVKATRTGASFGVVVPARDYRYTVTPGSAQYFSFEALRGTAIYAPSIFLSGVSVVNPNGINRVKITVQNADATRASTDYCGASTYTCIATYTSATTFDNCRVYLPACVDADTNYIIKVEGIELHSSTNEKMIWYTLRADVTPTVTPINVNTTLCDRVQEDHATYYHVTPGASTPETYLTIVVSDIRSAEDVTLQAYNSKKTGVTDVPQTSSCSDVKCDAFGTDLTCTITYLCPYTDLYFAVFGVKGLDQVQPINYRITVTQLPIFPVALKLDQLATDNLCTDQIVYKLTLSAADLADIEPSGTDGTHRFLRIAYNGQAVVDVKHGSFGDSLCSTSHCSTPAGSSCTFDMFCDSQVGDYYIYVQNKFDPAANGFNIKASIINSTYRTLPLNTPKAISLVDGQLIFFATNTSSTAIDQEMDISLTNIQGGTVKVYTRRGAWVGSSSSCYHVTASTTDWTQASTVLTVPNCIFGNYTWYTLIVPDQQYTCQPVLASVLATQRSLNLPHTTLTAGVNVTSQVVPAAVSSYVFTESLAANQLVYFRLSDVANGKVSADGNVGAPSTSGCSKLLCKPTDSSCANFLLKDGTGYCAFEGLWTVDQTANTNSHLYFDVAGESAIKGATQAAYNIQVSQRGWSTLADSVAQTTTWKSSNFQMAFFTATVTGGARLAVKVADKSATNAAEDVLVRVSDKPCFWSSQYRREFVCRPGIDCAIEFEAHVDSIRPTRAQTFYIVAWGRNTQFDTWFNAKGRCATGLSAASAPFCGALVVPNTANTVLGPYNIWTYDNVSVQDSEAKCYYEFLKSKFTGGCGSENDCDLALRRYACYSKFPKCDANNFASQICAESCEVVNFYCAKTFITAGLEALNCSNAVYAYADHDTDECTGQFEVVPPKPTTPPPLTGLPLPPVIPPPAGSSSEDTGAAGHLLPLSSFVVFLLSALLLAMF